jgi:hypothetical protein
VSARTLSELAQILQIGEEASAGFLKVKECLQL